MLNEPATPPKLAGMASRRPLPFSVSPVTLPSPSVSTPCQSFRGAVVSQLVLLLQPGPPVAK